MKTIPYLLLLRNHMLTNYILINLKLFQAHHHLKFDLPKNNQMQLLREVKFQKISELFF